MKVTFSHVCPPIPVRSADWVAHFDDAEGPVGYGATKCEALNDLLDNADVEHIARHFGIKVSFVDPCRGPEHGRWIASTESGDVLESPWRETAITDLAFMLVEAAQ